MSDMPAPTASLPGPFQPLTRLDIAAYDGRLLAIEKAMKRIEELLEHRTKWDKPILAFKDGAELLNISEGRFEAIILKYRQEHHEDPPFLSKNDYTRRLIDRDELIRFAMARKTKKRPVGRPGKETP